MPSSPSSKPPSPGIPPGSDLDLQDPQVVIDLFERAADANLHDGYRHGAIAQVPAQRHLLMTGDLHDHGLNLQRIIKLAALDRSADRVLVLHEIVHGPNFINGKDLSIRTLARVAALKLQYPNQVLLLQANHELAQLGGQGISKDGVNVVEAFDAGVDFIYQDQAQAVNDAMRKFIHSMLLGIRCSNGVFCSHSVPSPRKLESFDHTVIDRVPTYEDLSPGGSGYEMVWGRNHTPQSAEQLANLWDVEIFVMGHQPAEMGYIIETRSMLVLASDHAHGMVLPVNTSSRYDMDQLIESLVPLASVSI